MKPTGKALLALLLLGIVKWPLEHGLTQQLRQARLLSAPITLDLRENLSQMGFAACLGGLRSLVASITYLRAYHAWENVRWAQVDRLLTLSASLQPRYHQYWEDGSWHMAYNAASYYLYDEKLEPFVRGKLYREHIERGISILQQGLKHLPDEPRLWNELAEIYERRSREPRLAADAYLKVHSLTGNDRYQRFAAYQYALTADPQLWQKAHDLLMLSYRKNQRTPSLIHTLKQLEQRLNIPMMKRIPDAQKPMEISPVEQGPVRQ